MKIYIECTSSLNKFLKVSEQSLEDAKGYSIEYIIKLCNIPADEVGFVTVNGKKESFDYIVFENDKIKFFPTIIAG